LLAPTISIPKKLNIARIGAILGSCQFDKSEAAEPAMVLSADIDEQMEV